MGKDGAARWEYYVLLREERLSGFWAERVASEGCNVLFVIGRGFDPRMTTGLKTVLAAGGGGARDVLGLQFREGAMSASLNHEIPSSGTGRRLWRQSGHGVPFLWRSLSFGRTRVGGLARRARETCFRRRAGSRPIRT